MKTSCAQVVLALIGIVLLTGCASMFEDPLLAAYEAGELSAAEYEQLCIDRSEASARADPAHWQREQTALLAREKLRAQ